jgi:hypothetical protein
LTNECNYETVTIDGLAAMDLAQKASKGLEVFVADHRKATTEKWIERANGEIDRINSFWHSGWCNLFGRKPIQHVTDEPGLLRHLKAVDAKKSGDHWGFPDSVNYSWELDRYLKCENEVYFIQAAAKVAGVSTLQLSIDTIKRLQRWARYAEPQP